jgi:SpoIVB peptidase S55
LPKVNRPIEAINNAKDNPRDALIASRSPGGYHKQFMASTRRGISFVAAVLLLAFVFLPSPARSQRTAEHASTRSLPTFPLDQIKPGMRGEVYTIFTGDQIEKVDLEVLGILHNAIGPKQDIILVQLLGDKAQHTGVVAGMSGSPVYFDGKLAGALSLKLGVFTKEAIGGVTPISNMLDVVEDSATSAAHASAAAPMPYASLSSPAAMHVPVPAEMARRVSAGSSAGAGAFLVPIETPLISTGIYPETLAQFGKEFASWGMSVTPGGTADPSTEDAQIKPGDMVGLDLVRGDLSLSPGCTVTTVDDGRILACGHPIFSFGSVAIPMSRAHVVTTLASSMASTKIISTGGTIGTLTQDRLTAVMGQLGSGPPMIPVDVVLTTPVAEKKFHFEVIESPQLTPVLVALSAFNGIVSTPAYGEGSTLQLDGSIELENHTPVRLENLFAPLDVPVPAGFFVATAVQASFARIYSNQYELPKVKHVNLHVTAMGERRSAMIENAWVEKSEVEPGETVAVKVLLRPYRGEPFIQELPVTIPPQASRGTLQLVVSDADTLNRNVQFFAAAQAQLPGLEELINLINRERRNDRLYATLMQPTPTLLVEDKEMPNAPISEIDILDQRQNTGGARVLYQSKAGEWSVEMHQVIAGERVLPLTVK